MLSMFYVVTEPMTLLEAAALMSPDSSKTTLRQWIRDGRITVDGKTVDRANTPLLLGQKIALAKKKKFLANSLNYSLCKRHVSFLKFTQIRSASGTELECSLP